MNKRKKKKMEISENLNKSSRLTDKQRLFCSYYISSFNATKAYQKAYNCAYDTAKVNASRMLSNICIKHEIDRLKDECMEEVNIENKELSKMLLQKYIDIAFSDITDFVNFGIKEVEVARDETGNPIMQQVNYLEFKESSQVDGTLITEISYGKNGSSIKLADKMKAMEFLTKYVGLLDIPTRTKLALEIQKVNGDKQQGNQLAEAAKKLIDRMNNKN